jgi:class 3 adenylate cyclase
MADIVNFVGEHLILPILVVIIGGLAVPIFRFFVSVPKEVANHDARAAELNEDLRRWVRDRDRQLKAELRGVRTGSGLALYSGSTTNKAVYAMRRVLHEYRDEATHKVRDFSALARSEGRHALMLVPGLERESPEAVAEWAGRLQRYSASPGTARRLYDLIGELDVRDILGQVRAPTLVMHREASRWMDPGHSGYLAQHLPNSRYLALPGEDTLAIGDRAAPLLDALEEFLTGARPRDDADRDRTLATVLFTDIVDSTRRAAQLGDADWRRLLDRYNRVAAEVVERYRGRLVKSLGDGHLATFDGPARGIRCALALIEATRGLGIELRAGLHTGEIELIDGDVGGIGVHIGARVAALAGAEEVLVSSTVADLVVGSGIQFKPHGQHELKGVPSPWTLLRVSGA